MNASKENVQLALDNLLTQEGYINQYAFDTIKALLEAAKKKLPTEASYAREKTKRKEKVRK